MTIQKIYYSNAPCGAGKTSWAVEHMGRTPGRYIYAVDRTDEFTTRQNLIMRHAFDGGGSVRVRTLSNKAGDIVSRDFPLVIERYSHEDHVVIIDVTP